MKPSAWHSLAIELVRHGQKAGALECVEKLIEKLAVCPFQERDKFLSQYRAVEAQLLKDDCCCIDIRETLEAMTAPFEQFVATTCEQCSNYVAGVLFVGRVERLDPANLQQVSQVSLN